MDNTKNIEKVSMENYGHIIEKDPCMGNSTYYISFAVQF